MPHRECLFRPAAELYHLQRAGVANVVRHLVLHGEGWRAGPAREGEYVYLCELHALDERPRFFPFTFVFAGEARDKVCGNSDTWYCLPAVRHYPLILGCSVVALHPGEGGITTALERQMKVRGKPAFILALGHEGQQH